MFVGIVVAVVVIISLVSNHTRRSMARMKLTNELHLQIYLDFNIID